MRGESNADGHVADSVFKDKVPADNPRDKFAHGGVGVCVGAAGDGNHGGKLGVTDGGETASDGDENEGKRDGWACSWTSKRSAVMDEVFEQRRVEDGTGREFLTGDGRADDGENAGADYGTDAERGKAQPAKRLF